MKTRLTQKYQITFEFGLIPHLLFWTMAKKKIIFFWKASMIGSVPQKALLHQNQKI
jgi:hypothetical protein